MPRSAQRHRRGRFGDLRRGLQLLAGDAIINLPSGVNPYSIDITNTTYTAQSITQGDQFARAFHQGDYFRLDILGFSGLNGTGTQVGDVPFFLADYRGSTLQLVSNWTTVSLITLSGAGEPGFHTHLDRQRPVRDEHPGLLRGRQHRGYNGGTGTLVGRPLRHRRRLGRAVLSSPSDAPSLMKGQRCPLYALQPSP